MSFQTGLNYTSAFSGEIGLTLEERSALDSFLTPGTMIELIRQDVRNQFGSIEAVTLETFAGSLSVGEIAQHYEIATRLAAEKALLFSAFAKITVHLDERFVFTGIPLSEAVRSAQQVLVDLSTDDNRFAAEIVIGNFVNAFERYGSSIPAAVGFSKMTFLKAGDKLVDAWEFVNGLENAPSIEDLEDYAKVYNAFLSLLTKGAPLIYEIVSGEFDEGLNFAKLADVFAELLAPDSAVTEFLGAGVGTVSVLQSVLSARTLIEENSQLLEVRSSAGEIAQRVIDLSLNAQMQKLLSTIIGTVATLADVIGTVAGGEIADVIGFGSDIVDGLTTQEYITNYQTLALYNHDAAAIELAAVDLATALGTYLSDVLDHVGSAPGLAETLLPPETLEPVAVAPEIVLESAVSIDVPEGTRIVRHIDVVEAGLFTLEIVGGVDADLFMLAPDGTLSFRTAPDFETPRDAGADNVYDLILCATDQEGLSDTAALRVRVTDRDETTPAAGFPAAISNLTAAETTEGALLSFRVDLAAPAPENGTIHWSVQLASAEASDLAALSGQVDVTAGSTSATIALPTKVDADLLDETLTLPLVSASGGVTLSQPISATGIIRDVTSPADLAIEAATFDRGSVTHDGFGLLSFTATNLGDSPALTDFALVIDGGPLDGAEIGRLQDVSLASGGTRSLTVRLAPVEASSIGVDAAFVLPDVLSGGLIGLRILADPDDRVAETRSDNNTGPLVSFALLDQPLPGLPNLEVDHLSVRDSTTEAGAQITVDWSLANTGEVDAGPSRIGLYLSEGPTLDASSVRIQTFTAPGVTAGSQEQGSATALVAFDATTGGYSLHLVADVPYNGNSSQIAETDETDNISAPVDLLIGEMPNVGGSSLILSDATWTHGGSVQGSITVTNTSAFKTYAGYATLVLSDDTTIGADDDTLTRVVVPELAAGETRVLPFDFYVYDSFGTGTFNAGVYLDQVPGDTNPVDNVIGPIQVDISAVVAPTGDRDLAFAALSFEALSATVGGAVRAHVSIENAGTLGSTGGAVRF